MERLDTLVKEVNNYRILCPNQAFIDKLVAFYPHLAEQNLRTVCQILCELGCAPVTDEIANIAPTLNPFRNPLLRWMDYVETLSETEQSAIKTWLKDVGGVTLDALPQTSAKFCETCIFFGPFDSKCLNELQGYLKPFFGDFFAVGRTFLKNFDLQWRQIKGYGVRNIQQEREYIRNVHDKNTNFIACHPENWFEVFPLKTDPRYLRWIDYQEEGTLGYFLPYLYASIEDKKTRNDVIKKLQDAQRCCLREDLLSLESWLSQQNEGEILPLMYLDWPSEDPLGNFVRLLNGCGCAWTLHKALETCPIKFTRRQFFAYLRRNVKRYKLEHLIPWEEALYLPIKSGCFLHGISENFDSDIQRLSWFKEIENRGGTLIVIIPERDEKNMSYTPLIPVVAKSEEVKQKLEALNFPKEFALPKNRIKFSCKNWERFRLSPIRTWLDAILKVKKFDLIQPNVQARICGEWVHENLEFTAQPKNLEAWQASIREKAERRWQILSIIFAEKLPIQLQQWHIRTYRLSLQMAQACSDLLDGSWTLQSEYVLPKTAENSGRIDLLATRSKEAVIVDFKTAVDYTFTAKKLNKGHGLQLLLYGKALETYFDHIQLRVINGNCSNFTLNLHEITSEVHTIEAWLEAIKRTGTYVDLPEEKRESLPLCWL